MCLILVAHCVHPTHRLVLAANRDEFLDRPAEPMRWWNNPPQILAGKDLRQGGTWMGIARDGRWAALTNYRLRGDDQPDRPSRGEIVTGYLSSEYCAVDFLHKLHETACQYNGFNLLVADKSGLYYYGNRVEPDNVNFDSLPPGIYGLSNHLLNTPWPKVELGRAGLENLCRTSNEVDHEDVLGLLSDRSRPEDDLLPDTGIGIEKERLLSPMFIESPGYGTRCSTSLIVDDDNFRICEFTHDDGSKAEFTFCESAVGS